MSKKILFGIVIVFGLLVSACAPEDGIQDAPALEQLEFTITPGEPIEETPAATVEPPQNEPPATAEAAIPVTGRELSGVTDYSELYGYPVVDEDGNMFGTLAEVIPGPQGYTDFGMVYTFESLYRTVPVSALVVDDTNQRLYFEGKMEQLMGSPTFDTVDQLDFALEQVNNAVIGYWQHQADIEE